MSHLGIDTLTPQTKVKSSERSQVIDVLVTLE